MGNTQEDGVEDKRRRKAGSRDGPWSSRHIILPAADGWKWTRSLEENLAAM